MMALAAPSVPVLDVGRHGGRGAQDAQHGAAVDGGDGLHAGRAGHPGVGDEGPSAGQQRAATGVGARGEREREGEGRAGRCPQGYRRRHPQRLRHTERPQRAAAEHRAERPAGAAVRH